MDDHPAHGIVARHGQRHIRHVYILRQTPPGAYNDKRQGRQ
jgi:hypothetical protein